jgi:hypothetical protein
VKCEDALGAGLRKHRNFEESVLDAIAPIGGITGSKLRLTGAKLHHLGVSE